MANRDVCAALTYLADVASSGDSLRLVEVKRVDSRGGESLPPDMKMSIEFSGVGVYWLALDNPSVGIERILLTSLDTEKLERLVRKWNKGGTTHSFEISTRVIGAPEAISFYETAAYKQPHLIDAVLKAMKRPANQRRRRRHH